MLALLLSGDIHANPGPKTEEITVKDKSGVAWGQAGVCCDNCEVWFHKTCLSLNTSSFKNIQDSNVSWICNKCNFTNSESSLFQSYNLELHNSYTEHCAACSDQTQTARVYQNADSSPSKHEDSTQCCFNVGPAPLAVG